MPISDYDDSISLTVQSISGTPTISKVQPIYLVDADGVVRGLLWVYNNWVRDGTIQAKIAFGDGPEDRSMDGTGKNPWDNGQGNYISSRLNGSANDSGPNDYSLTNYGATESSGQFSSSMSFDAIDDYISSDQEIAKKITPVFTGWFNTSNSTDVICIMSHGRGGKDYGDIIVRVDSGNIRVTWDDDNGWNNATGSVSVADGAWHHVVVDWRSDGSIYVYVDGGLDFSTTYSWSSISNSALWKLGEQRNSGEYFDGKIDEARNYDADVSQDWAQAEYDASDIGGQSFFSRNSSSGPFQIDFSKIGGFSDIAVYDQNDNLLDYEIEKLNPPTNTPGSITDTDDSGVVQTDSDGVVTTG